MHEYCKLKKLFLIFLILFLVLYILPNLNFFSNQQSSFYLPEIVNCSTFNFDSNVTNKLPIYDFFLFINEFDQLEIRLYELYDYVTLFLIAESNQTFTGKTKPLYLKENWERFAKYHRKMIRVEINLTNSEFDQTDTWKKEALSRYVGIQLALPKSSTDFILLTSDVDEIPKARFVWSLANCQLPDQFSSLLLQCDYYFYSYEFRNARNPYSLGVSVSRFASNQNIPFNLRTMRVKFRSIFGGCFHCSYCFDRISMVHEKLNSFSHTEVNLEKYHRHEHIIDRFQNGKDLFDRRKEQLRRTIPHETELPKLLKDEPQRFMYMITRSSAANAAFKDV